MQPIADNKNRKYQAKHLKSGKKCKIHFKISNQRSGKLNKKQKSGTEKQHIFLCIKKTLKQKNTKVFSIIDTYTTSSNFFFIVCENFPLIKRRTANKKNNVKSCESYKEYIHLCLSRNIYYEILYFFFLMEIWHCPLMFYFSVRITLWSEDSTRYGLFISCIVTCR